MPSCVSGEGGKSRLGLSCCRRATHRPPGCGLWQVKFHGLCLALNSRSVAWFETRLTLNLWQSFLPLPQEYWVRHVPPRPDGSVLALTNENKACLCRHMRAPGTVGSEAS